MLEAILTSGIHSCSLLWLLWSVKDPLGQPLILTPESNADYLNVAAFVECFWGHQPLPSGHN